MSYESKMTPRCGMKRMFNIKTFGIKESARAHGVVGTFSSVGTIHKQPVSPYEAGSYLVPKGLAQGSTLPLTHLPTTTRALSHIALHSNIIMKNTKMPPIARLLK